MDAAPDAGTLGALRPALRDGVEAALEGRRLTDAQALALADARGAEHPALWAAAAALRDRGRPPVVTYSRQVFIPLTNLCRDVCSYCTFAHLDTDARAHTMSPDEVLQVAEAGRRLGCKEALFTLGDRPEARFESHRRALRRFGHDSTQSYLRAMCRAVLEQTGLLPHPNAGILGRRELEELREVSASQGMMLESVSERLCGPGGPHEHAPDKRPKTRLAMIRRAGELRIPFTSGILIGIGETARERVEALLALRDLHEAHGHIQEVIVQNFRAKPDTPMAASGEPGLAELMTACALARLVMGPRMSIQAPPNLSADYGPLLLAGINDWGGVSPSPPTS
jgi:FO synthase